MLRHSLHHSRLSIKQDGRALRAEENLGAKYAHALDRNLCGEA